MFAVCAPGLESILAGELKDLGFSGIRSTTGGVAFGGDMSALMRANLHLRSATRVLLRLARFRVHHLAELDRKLRQQPWQNWLPAGAGLRIQATCRRSKIYHSGAVTERICRAIGRTDAADPGDDQAQTLLARIEDNECTISLDSSGAPLYQRGLKLETSAAPMRENLAAGFLLACGFDGREAFVDPMCGSGTFPLEAASLATHSAPGLNRAFAFERWPRFEPAEYDHIRQQALGDALEKPAQALVASDIHPGAVGKTRRNLKRAGWQHVVELKRSDVADIEPPGDTGLMICNPPYGQRLGRKGDLAGLYRKLGQVFSRRFEGWRLALVTDDEHLALASGLTFDTIGPPVAHGGLKVRLYQTGRVGR
jgi:putative N6-adenine-specific DNA methylase